MDKTGIFFEDELSFAVHYSIFDYYIDFVVYDMIGKDQNGNRLFVESDSVAHIPVSSIHQAQAFLHGHVKWDGCSNWSFDEQERNMIHSCDRKGLLRLGEIMAICYDFAEVHLPIR